jgi:glycosyltransferase involved in cell wall biosynthesis
LEETVEVNRASVWSKDTKVKISIALATYNGEDFLAEQLDSLARQELLPSELQVGDDGSTDGTEQIVCEFATRAPFPVVFHKNETRLGFGENFIQTALRCSGDWIAFCDQDDVWSPAKLRRCADEIGRSDAPIDLIVHDARIVDENLEPGGLLYGIRTRAVHPSLSLPPEYYALGFTEVFRADLLTRLPCDRRVSFPWHNHREAHDVWIALLANMIGTICLIPDALVQFRRHGATTTTTGAPDAEPLRRFAPHGSEYRDRADYLEDVANVLQRCVSAADRSLRSRLETAISKVRWQAELLRLRSEAYQEPRLGQRLRSLWQILMRGGYFGGRGWPFGAARGAKDCLYVLAPAGEPRKPVRPE